MQLFYYRIPLCNINQTEKETLDSLSSIGFSSLSNMHNYVEYISAYTMYPILVLVSVFFFFFSFVQLRAVVFFMLASQYVYQHAKTTN
jgi:Ca2+/Na+ antiporter